MTLFELKALISLDDSNFVKKIDDAVKKGEGFSSKLSSAIQKAGDVFLSIGEKAAKGLAVAGGAFVGLSTAAVKFSGDLEQSIGGIETLFGSSAGTVIANAEEAFRTAGVSANDYMEQVTSFSASLLQSLGGDTEAAAKVADMAIIDMADNANKMGSSIESIQNAYQGFSKANYTMLDNLKLGYGGTKAEMERLLEDATKLTGIKYDITNLNDVYQAIHVIQEELGVTGTTALEAEQTLSGSFAAAKAAVENFLSGAGNISTVFDSISVYAGNLGRHIDEFLARFTTKDVEIFFIDVGNAIGAFIATLAERAPELIEVGFKFIDSFFGGMFDGLSLLDGKLGDIIAVFVQGFMGYLGNLFHLGEIFGEEILKGLAIAFPQLSETFNSIIDLFYKIGDKVRESGMFEKIAELFGKIIEKVNDLAPLLIDLFGDGIVLAIEAITTALDFLNENFETVMAILVPLTGAFIGYKAALAISTIIDKATASVKLLATGFEVLSATLMANPFVAITAAIAALVAGIIYLWNTNEDFRNFIINAWENIKAVVGGAIEAIAGFFTVTIPEAINTLKEKFIEFKDKIVETFENVKQKISEIIENIKSKFEDLKTGLIEAFTNIKDKIQETISNIVTWFTELPQKIKDAIIATKEKVVEWATETYEVFQEKVTEIIENVTKFFSELPDKIAYGIGYTARKVYEWGKETYEAFVEKTTEIIDTVIKFFSELPQKIWDAIIAAKDRITEWGNELYQIATDKITQLIDDVVKFLSELPGKIYDAIKDAITRFSEWASTIYTNTTDKIKELISNVVSFLSELPSKIWNAIKDAITRFLEWGSQIYTTATTKITEMVTGVITKISELPGKIATKLSEIISKVVTWGSDMISNAHKTASDFVSNMVNGIKGLPDQVGAWITSTVTMVKGKASEFLNAGRDLLQNLWNGFTEKWEAIKGWFEGIISTIGGWVEQIKKGWNDATSKSNDIERMANDSYQKASSHDMSEYNSGLQKNSLINSNDPTQSGLTINQFLQTVAQTPYEAQQSSEALFQQAMWGVR